MGTTEQSCSPVSSDEIDDYSIFSEGDVVPSLKKKIKYLIAGDHDFIVFLGDDLITHWACVDSCADKLPQGYGKILNRVGILETQSSIVIKDLDQLILFRRLLGESLARLLEKQSLDVSEEILDNTQKNLTEMGNNDARRWYLCSSLITSSVAIVMILIVGIFRSEIEPAFGKDFYDVLLGSLFGAPGALVSVISRTTKIDTEFFLGKSIHYLEGALRIIVAVIGALIVALSIKANIVGGFTNNMSNPTAFLILFCIASGASERLLPSIISKIESSVTKVP